MNFSTFRMWPAALRFGVRGAFLGLTLVSILALQPHRAWAGDPDDGGSSEGKPPGDDASAGEGASAGDDTGDDGGVQPSEPEPSPEDGDGVINTAAGGAGGAPRPPKNHRPVAFPSNLAGRKGEALNGKLRMRDRDTNDVLTVLIVRQPTKGTVVVGAGGQFVYTPKTAFTGRDRFGFQVSDGKAVSKSRRIEMRFRAPKTVRPAKNHNPAPSAGSS